MSSKKEEKSQDAADKIKAATLSAAKGLSRAQAERAAAAAARNVNAYGQKEEGPSRWQERKEAKRQMYLMSTEKAVRLGERKDLKMSSISGTAAQCQKCFQAGHWTYECKNERVYISRPSRSQQLKNPKLRQKPLSPTELDDADVRKERSPDKEEGEKRGKKSKRKHRSEKESDSDSEASVFDSQSESSSAAASDYSSEESASSESSSSDSEEERRRRRKRNKNKKQKKGRKKRYSSSSSESSDYESMSDSDSDDKSRRRKSKSRSHRR
ncbi:hypothetical protein Droror1_Dr00001038 [Drosera rotundifolia]